jgi:hypothetical protein
MVGRARIEALAFSQVAKPSALPPTGMSSSQPWLPAGAVSHCWTSACSCVPAPNARLHSLGV